MEVQLSIMNISLLFSVAIHRPVRKVPLILQGFVYQRLKTARLMDIWMNQQETAKNSQHSHSTPVDLIKPFRSCRNH